MMTIKVLRGGEVIHEQSTEEEGDVVIEFGRLNIQGEHIFEPPYSLEIEVIAD